MKARILLLSGAIALASCGGAEPAADEANQMAAPADIETLPPDESVATPTDDLVDGTTDVPADANATGANAVDANSVVGENATL